MAKMAYMMFQERQETLGPPRLDRELQIYRVGKERFVVVVTILLNSRHRHEALYGLGWFGDRRHVRFVAEVLESEDGETRRIALAAFSRLTCKEFSDSAEAIEWWAVHKNEYPHVSLRWPDK